MFARHRHSLTRDSYIREDDLFLQTFPLCTGMFLAWAWAGFVCAMTIAVVLYMELPYHMQKTLFPCSHSPPLALTLSVHSCTMMAFWGVGTKCMFPLGLSILGSLTLCLSQWWVSVNHYILQVSASQMKIERCIDQWVGLIPCPFSIIILVGSPLEPMSHLTTDSCPIIMTNMVFFCRARLKSNQKVVGYLCNIHSIIEPVTMYYQVSC